MRNVYPVLFTKASECKSIYPSYSNRNYCASKVVEIIDKSIVNEILRIGAEEVKE